MIGGWRTLRRRSMIVNLDTGTSFEGVLFATHGPLLEFRQARVLERSRDPTPIGGEVIVDRARVEFVQVVAPRTSP